MLSFCDEQSEIDQINERKWSEKFSKNTLHKVSKFVPLL